MDTTTDKKQSKTLSNSNWFPHDMDCTADPKLVALLGMYGADGYAVFWRVTEILHKEPAHTLDVRDDLFFAGIAGQFKLDIDRVKAIVFYAVTPCKLFAISENSLSSNRVFRNIERRTEIKEIRRESASKGGKATQAKAKQMLKHDLSTSQANGKQMLKQNQAEESRVEEIPIGISPLLITLQDSLKGSPTSESLLRAFLSGYPLRLKNGEVVEFESRWRNLDERQCREAIDNLIIDLETARDKNVDKISGLPDHFDNPCNFLPE